MGCAYAKIPYQIMIGDNELFVRKYGEKKTVNVDREEFLQNILEEATKQ